jgi:hypothetical protein
MYSSQQLLAELLLASKLLTKWRYTGEGTTNARKGRGAVSGLGNGLSGLRQVHLEGG